METIVIVWVVALIFIAMAGVIIDKLCQKYSELEIGYKSLLAKHYAMVENCRVMRAKIDTLMEGQNCDESNRKIPIPDDWWGAY